MYKLARECKSRRQTFTINSSEKHKKQANVHKNFPHHSAVLVQQGLISGHLCYIVIWIFVNFTPIYMHVLVPPTFLICLMSFLIPVSSSTMKEKPSGNLCVSSTDLTLDVRLCFDNPRTNQRSAMQLCMYANYTFQWIIQVLPMAILRQPETINANMDLLPLGCFRICLCFANVLSTSPFLINDLSACWLCLLLGACIWTSINPWSKVTPFFTCPITTTPSLWTP